MSDIPPRHRHRMVLLRRGVVPRPAGNGPNNQQRSAANTEMVFHDDVHYHRVDRRIFTVLVVTVYTSRRHDALLKRRSGVHGRGIHLR